MLEFLAQNYGTIIVVTILAAVCALIIISWIRGKKKGRSSCGCGCANCPMRGKCHK